MCSNLRSGAKRWLDGGQPLKGRTGLGKRVCITHRHEQESPTKVVVGVCQLKLVSMLSDLHFAFESQQNRASDNLLDAHSVLCTSHWRTVRRESTLLAAGRDHLSCSVQ